MAVDETPTPATGEELHLPGPTLLPLFVAVGLTLVVVGLTTTVIILIAGGVLALVAILRWIADLRREVDSLPLEH